LFSRVVEAVHIESSHAYAALQHHRFEFGARRGNSLPTACRCSVPQLSRELKLFSQALVAIDGSKFKAVNTRERNFTEGKVDKRQKQIEESIQRYLDALETADRTQPAELEAKMTRLQDKIARLREQMRNLEQIKEQLKTQPDGQLSITDPDARSMATSGKGSGMVGYNVQVAVDAKHHLIVAHEVTNSGSDRAQLSPMAIAARDAMGKTRLRAVADRGYYTGTQIRESPMRALPSCCRSRQRQVRNTMADSARQTLSTLRGTTNTNV
jgi:Transposase DDE domain